LGQSNDGMQIALVDMATLDDCARPGFRALDASGAGIGHATTST
jgi:hypothetical protein